MKAVGYQKSLPITEAKSLVDIELPKPTPGGRDLLVKVQAVSVNPVDTKMRMRAEPPAGGWQVLGWDAVGVVEAAGPDAKLFKAGDSVFYAGSINRQGTNAEFHLVDERIVGPKPKSLSNAEAAALPLTAITAWEMLFDRLDVKKPVPGAANAILIIGGAGGVGSIAIQLARALTDLIGHRHGLAAGDRWPGRSNSAPTMSWITPSRWPRKWRSSASVRRHSCSRRQRRTAISTRSSR